MHHRTTERRLGSGARLVAAAALASVAIALHGEPMVETVAPRSPRPALVAGAGPDSIAAGDFNGDRILDLAVANRDSNSISVFIGHGDGTFDTARDFDTGTGPQSIRAVDLNSDHILDLVTANAASRSLSVLRGDGRGGFQPAIDVPVSFESDTQGCATCLPLQVIDGEMTGDATPDLAVAYVGANVLSVVPGHGDGSFGDRIAQAGFVRDDPQSIAAADFNGDGRLDLATANFDFMSVSTLQGNGDGTFATAAEATTGSFASALAAGDLNGDGSPDLVVANRAFKRETFEYGRDSVTVLLGDGAGHFVIRSETPAGSGPAAVALADFDGDQHVDAAVANGNANTVSLFFGKGDGTFGRRVDVETGAGPSAVAVGDFDGDGAVDLAVANANAGTVSVILNEWMPPADRHLVLKPVADAYVAAGVSASEHFGGALSLRVKKGIAPENTRRSYLKFDIRDVGSVQHAVLRLYGHLSSASTRVVRVTLYGVDDNGWDERTITWNTRPALDAVLRTVDVDGVVPRWFEVDLTSFVRAQRTAGHAVVTIALRSVVHTSAYATFNSREAAAGAPELVVTR
jgi:FG-GAP-like repeat